MFRQLRNKFLILNLVIISVMMLISFTSIYLITYNNVHRDVDLELHKIMEVNRKSNDNPKEPRPNFDTNQPSPNTINPDSGPERSVTFTLITDAEGKIISSFSIFNTDEQLYVDALKAVSNRNADTGSFKLDGYYWAFIMRPHQEGYKIVFMDITSQQGILTNLIYTFLLVAFVMMIVIFFISRFFANKSIKPIKEAFDRQKQFIADASHELKTPLAVINTNVDVLLSNTENTIAAQSKWLYYIKSEVERMAKLTNDLLYLTQMDYTDIKMIFSEFNISEALENVIMTMEAVFYESNITLSCDIEPNLIAKGNCEQIKQVIMILLDNSLKYTNSNGSVDVALKKSHSNTILTVTNTGKGIPEESLSKVFDRFYRIDKSRSRNSGGYGLGLAIAKAIVEQHGGRISVKSVLDRSTTFMVELPRII